MTLATAPVRRPSARTPVGWRPTHERPFPTLGWVILDHAHRYLRSPRDERKPFVFTDEQADHILEMYRLDENGRRLFRRVHEEQAKGWGKSPFAAAIALEEFTGPVRFDGWDAQGQPVGAAWGVGGRPAPWVQIAAVSEDQTRNTFNALYGLLTADGGKVADELRIDDGRTRLYRKDMPSAYLELVTASAASREGQVVTFAILDEPQLWTPSNGGIRLAQTILRNVAKTDGWGLLTGNAPILGEGSVAEMFREPAVDVLHLANRPSEVPEQDWEPTRMRAQLDSVYGDAWWVPRERLLADIADPTQPWRDSLRFFFNHPVSGDGEGAWLPADAWKAATDPSAQLDPALPVGVGIRKSAHSEHAAVVVAQRKGEKVVVRCRTFPVESATGRVSTVAIRKHLHELRETYPRAMVRDKTRRPVPGPAFAFDRVQFEESAEMLEQDGLDMIETNHTAAVMAPPTTLTFELVTTGRLVHDGDPVLAEHVDAARVVQTERGIRIQPPRDQNVRPSHAAIALVMAVAMAMQEAPTMKTRAPRPPVGI